MRLNVIGLKEIANTDVKVKIYKQVKKEKDGDKVTEIILRLRITEILICRRKANHIADALS